jgi:hypothetical protein
MVTLPSDEQAKWDLLLLDIEHRIEHVRQLQAMSPWRLVFSGLTAGAAIFGAGIVFSHWVLG